MTSRVWPFCLCLLFSGPILAQTNAIKTLPDLQGRLLQHVSQSKFAQGTFGVKIVSAKSGKVLFENDPAELLSPASNAKLYTVGLALDRLGTDYRIQTSLYTTGSARNGRLAGDLVVYGRGDPTINPKVRGSLSKALAPLVAIVTNAGIREIQGDLVGDESFIRGPEFGSGWTWDDLESYYGAEISALTINDNLVVMKIKPGAKPGDPCQLELTPATSVLVISNRTTTSAAGQRQSIRLHRPVQSEVVYVSGSMPLNSDGANEDVTVPSPAKLFVDLFRRELEKAGVVVSGESRIRTWLDQDASPVDHSKRVELGSMASVPMSEIAREVQKPSQNLYTDLLLATVGEKTRKGSAQASTATSEDLGLRELRQFLAEAGVPPADVHFEEGSGLSRNNLTTPNATVALLLHMTKHPAADAYWNALPVAGVDGTLRNRLKNTAATGKVRAKTGTLRWAYSLSGDVITAAGERLIFSIMLNRYYNQDTSRSPREEIDVIPVMLAEFAGTVDP